MSIQPDFSERLEPPPLIMKPPPATQAHPDPQPHDVADTIAVKTTGAVRPDDSTAIGAATQRCDTLMLAVAAGDKSAFADLYEELAPKVFAMMTLFAIHRDPEEATFEAMVEIWRTAPNYAPSQGPTQTWCLKIASRPAIRTRRIAWGAHNPTRERKRDPSANSRV